MKGGANHDELAPPCSLKEEKINHNNGKKGKQNEKGTFVNCIIFGLRRF
jgi:hypothetical protein